MQRVTGVFLRPKKRNFAGKKAEVSTSEIMFAASRTPWDFESTFNVVIDITATQASLPDVCVSLVFSIVFSTNDTFLLSAFKRHQRVRLVDLTLVHEETEEDTIAFITGSSLRSQQGGRLWKIVSFISISKSARLENVTSVLDLCLFQQCQRHRSGWIVPSASVSGPEVYFYAYLKTDRFSFEHLG